jgi:hypothetical protein
MYSGKIAVPPGGGGIVQYYIVMNQVGNSKIPPSGHLIFFSNNIRNENKTREILK